MTSVIKKVAVVGTGVIGASWAAYFLANGYDVAAADPGPDAENRLRKFIKEFWPALVSLGLAKDEIPARLSFHENIAAAVKDADFIQENGPERLDIKRRIIAEIDAAAPADSLIATSSSGLLISDIQDAARHPERVLLGHPFNPPHLIPLVEVAGGRLTSPDDIQRTMDFYAEIGKKPIHIRHEVKGYVGNRLQAALWREALHLIDQGIVSVSDIDTAIAHGPGLRWALLGPFVNLHLSGGDGGIAQTLDHFGPSWKDWWDDMGNPALDTALKETITEGTHEELSRTDFDAMVNQRDELLINLLKQKKSSEHLL